ncbi:MAG: aminomethyl transferase family protein [Haloferacaceae archaeon]
MDPQSLQDVVDGSDNLARRFRETDVERGDVHFSVYQDEYTNWIEEQRAWRETCILMDQSYHLANYYFEGPDALKLNADLGIRDFEALADEEPPVAKTHPIPNPDGYLIGDPVLFYRGEEEVAVTGNRGLGQKWIQYNLETGDYDAELVDVYSPYGDEPPLEFRFEIQGPNAPAVMDELFDGGAPDISFFQMDTATIDGLEVFVLGHGMASSPGIEIFGPYEHHDDLKAKIHEIGAAHDLRELGGRAYKTTPVASGWLPPGLPAVYEHEDMQGYREWLDADRVEANWSLGGSFDSDDITDYYVDLVELGHDRFFDLDHEFVGRDALAERADDPDRKKVTFVWDGDDVTDVFASLFQEGPIHKFPKFPDLFQQWDLGHFDRVESDGEVVGLSMYSCYDVNVRGVISLGVVDTDYAAEGTELTLVWGEEESAKRNVESHVEKEISATVAPAPYVRAREDL